MSGEYLLDRERELALIEDSLGRASRGAGRVVVIDGAAGIGKTKLMAACCDRARARGMRVFTARCSELEREFSFGVVQQLFERLVARGSARPVVWSDTATSVAELLNPAEPPLRSEGLPDDNRWAALNALFWLTVDLAEPGPIVIAVDDMQWCDDSSSYFVDYLARRIDGLGVVLVVAARSGETDMSELMRNPAAVVVRPGPLSETASTEVIRAAYSAEPDDAFVDACQAATGGNALLVTELARALASDRVAPTADHVDQVLAVGSGALAQTVTHRLAGLGDDATRLARAAAVLGDGGSCRDAAELAGLEPERSGPAQVALIRSRILRAGGLIEFVHPLVREAVDASWGSAEAAQVHGHAAHLLGRTGAPPEVVAAHLLRSEPGRDPEVVETLNAAAHRALATGDPPATAAYLRRALAESPDSPWRARMLAELGTAEAIVEATPAIDHLRQALMVETDPGRRIETAAVLGRTLSFRGHFADAIDVCRRLLTERTTTRHALRERLEAVLLHVSCYLPDAKELADDLAEDVRQRAGTDTFGSRSLQALLAYRDARSGVPAGEAVPRAARALQGGMLLAEDNGGGPWFCATLVLIAADSDLAVETCDAGLARASGRGSVFAYTANKFLRGRALLCRGALAEAEAELEDGVSAAERWGLSVAPINAAYVADVRMEQGRLDAAQAVVDRVDGGSDRMLHAAYDAWLLERRARLELLMGRPESAHRAAVAAGGAFARIGGRNPAFVPWRSQAALALHTVGDAEQARSLAAEEIELARTWNAPRTLSRALRIAAIVEGGDRGLTLLREATAVCQGTPARLEWARCLVELGAALRRANRRVEARAWLRDGLRVAGECGASLLVAQARDELRAAGGRPRDRASDGIDALTPSEHRIAVQAARGKANLDIAHTLSIAPKTVEMHLSNVYRKLGVASRRELEARFLRDADGGRWMQGSVQGRPRRTSQRPAAHFRP